VCVDPLDQTHVTGALEQVVLIAILDEGEAETLHGTSMTEWYVCTTVFA
jgi:hypothetical protein